MDLPINEKTFVFDAVGSITGTEYRGEFTVKCVLNIGDKHQLELEKTRLQADYQNPTDGLASIAILLSNLRVRILKGPEWWEQSLGGTKILDDHIVVELYDKVMQQEDKWREEVKAKGKKSASKNKEIPTEEK